MTAENLIRYIDMNLDLVKKLPKPLTTLEAKELIDKYGYDDVIDMLGKMNNYAKLKQNYRSVYLTCNKWFELDIAKGYRKAPGAFTTPQNKLSEIDYRKQEFLRLHPVGSEYKSKAGQIYTVSTDGILTNKNTGKCYQIHVFLNDL